PAGLWVDGLAVRLFGLSSWSVLAPQAVLGVATVALLYASVRRTALTAGLASRLAPRAAPLAAARGPRVRPAHRRGAVRGRGARRDARRRADLPVQQPGRAAHAAAGGSGVRDVARDRARRHQFAAAGRAPRRVRVPHEDAAGVPRAARAGGGV